MFVYFKNYMKNFIYFIVVCLQHTDLNCPLPLRYLEIWDSADNSGRKTFGICSIFFLGKKAIKMHWFREVDNKEENDFLGCILVLVD